MLILRPNVNLVTWFLGLMMLFTHALHAEPLRFVKQNSAPKYLENGSLGICDQIYQLLIPALKAKQIDVEILPSFVPVKRIFQMLETGNADVFCGANKTEHRFDNYVYSNIPVYEVNYVLAAPNDFDVNIDSLETLVNNKYVVGGLFGTASSEWAMKKGITMDDSYHNLETPLKIVEANNHLKLFYYHDLGLNYLIKTNHLALKILPLKLRTISQWMVFSKHTSADSIQIMNEVIQSATQNGELKAIQNQHLSP